MHVLVLSPFQQQTPQNPAPAGDATTAPATGAGQQGPAPSGSEGGGLPIWAMYPVIIAIFYFLMIAPERKQRKKREAMLAAVKKGDKVITTGGMYASVAAVNEDSITLQASDDVRLRFARSGIAQVLEVDGVDASPKS